MNTTQIFKYNKLLILHILVLLTAFPANSAVYYVSTYGNTSNPGTIDQPWDLSNSVTNEEVSESKSSKFIVKGSSDLI